MINKTKAWIELFKLGKVGTLREDIDDFFRGNIIRILKEEGLFDFLYVPRAIGEIAQKFEYYDKEFLKRVMDALISDKTLKKTKYDKYYLAKELNDAWVSPAIFEDSLIQLFMEYANALPDRLRGKYLEFTSGTNLFNWDDALTNKMYSQIRKSAFAYANVTNRPVKFLDIGCGNGYTSTVIWLEYFEKGHFNNGNEMEIVGIDLDEDLLEIARDEFLRRLTRLSDKDRTYWKKQKHLFPKFMKGDIVDIPCDDNTFDVVYVSQVLHWTNAKKAIEEMLRVTKKGGCVFGTENLYPSANPYNDLHFRVIEGAQGFFYKKDLLEWVNEAGGKKIKIATPISVFVIYK